MLGFGLSNVSGRRRVPVPPQSMQAFIKGTSLSLLRQAGLACSTPFPVRRGRMKPVFSKWTSEYLSVSLGQVNT
jgi:hypothetical protein